MARRAGEREARRGGAVKIRELLRAVGPLDGWAMYALAIGLVIGYYAGYVRWGDG